MSGTLGIDVLLQYVQEYLQMSLETMRIASTPLLLVLDGAHARRA